jgi:hypothetical protein
LAHTCSIKANGTIIPDAAKLFCSALDWCTAIIITYIHIISALLPAIIFIEEGGLATDSSVFKGITEKVHDNSSYRELCFKYPKVFCSKNSPRLVRSFLKNHELSSTMDNKEIQAVRTQEVTIIKSHDATIREEKTVKDMAYEFPLPIL